MRFLVPGKNRVFAKLTNLALPFYTHLASFSAAEAANRHCSKATGCIGYWVFSPKFALPSGNVSVLSHLSAQPTPPPQVADD
jgi:hypothetical protein